MPKAESKNCPRCNKLFECKAGSGTACQCSAITITPELKIFLEQQYKDCLCNDCLEFFSRNPELFKKK